jgi:hypothetical protein
MASWPERAGALLASRWVGRIEPAEFDVLAEKAEPLGMGAIKLLLPPVFKRPCLGSRLIQVA